jgi:electron transfer flavoprotein alpha subunit
VISLSLKKSREKISLIPSNEKLPLVAIVGEDTRELAESIGENITLLPLCDALTLKEKISKLKPNAVLFGSDTLSKRVSAEVGAMLNLGLCADCTMLETDGKTLYMYRPALSGRVIAKIESLASPALATVRTSQDSSNIVVCAGYGAKDSLKELQSFAKEVGADVSATRKSVDYDLLPYGLQVGLTGKTVSPSVYIAIGVSGAVHHLAGMQSSGTVIAINPDKDAQIFDYADYGIVATAEEFFSAI